MSAVTLGLTTRPATSPAEQGPTAISTRMFSSPFRTWRGPSRVFYGLFLVMLWTAVTAPRAAGQAAQKPASVTAASGSNNVEIPGNETCAKCHRGISDTYAETAMARASGSAMQGFLAGELQHAASGVQYRVYEADGDAWLSFDRSAAPELHGKRK